jgi:hypothetical protein
MRHIFRLSFLLIIIISGVSCKRNFSSENIVKKDSLSWNSIILGLDAREIVVNNFDDSLSLKRWDYKDSIVENGRFWMPINFETENIKIKNDIADSIYKWTKKLTAELITPQRFCTCYAGNLKLTIKYGYQISQSCEYSSICDWKTMCPETIKLDSLFKVILKKYK